MDLLDMSHRPSARKVAEQDRFLLLRQKSFRAAAYAVTASFVPFAEVQRVALFGSVARPLTREVPRFQPYRRLGIELLHECKDVDLAVWLTDFTGLSNLGRARNRAVSEVDSTAGPGRGQDFERVRPPSSIPFELDALSYSRVKVPT